MKFYLITRTDETDWDETNAILVRAEDRRAARKMALISHAEAGDEWATSSIRDQIVHDGFRPDNLKISEVKTEGKPEVIIIDFLRG